MKKCLIFLGSLLVSFFLFQNKVFASDVVITESVYNANSKQFVDIELEIDKTSFDSFFLDDINEFKSYCNSYSCSAINSLVNKLNNGDFNSYLSQYDYYIINDAGDYNTNRIIFFNSNDIHFSWENTTSNVQSLYIYFTGGVYYQSGSYTNISSLGYNFRLNNGYFIRDIRNTNIFTSSFSNINKKYISSNDIKTLILGKSLAPTIDISKIGDIYADNDTTKPIIGADLNINFSEYNTNKYVYEYSTDLNNWSILMQNNSQIILYDNVTVYVQIKDLNNNILTSSTYTVTTIDKTPKIYFDIDINEEETAKKNFERTIYMITFTYYNMTEDYYSIYYNLTDGTSKNLGYNVQEHIINYVNDDAILTVYIYDKNNNMIDHATIDLNLLKKDLNTPYIQLFGQDMVNTKNTIAYTYNNTNDNDHKCYYQFGGDSEPTQESCSTENIIVRHASYNTYLHVFIKDNNNNILDEKTVQLSFFTGFPRLEFESYYNGISKSQLLNIKLIDYTDEDTLFYSTDKDNWTQLPTQELNTLYFTSNTDVYFKIKRNNEDVADGYYYVEVGSYSISISENNTIDEIHNLTDDSTTGYVKSFLKTITIYIKEFSKIIQYFFNSLPVQIRSFLISIFVLFILMIIVLIARGRR